MARKPISPSRSRNLVNSSFVLISVCNCWTPPFLAIVNFSQNPPVYDVQYIHSHRLFVKSISDVVTASESFTIGVTLTDRISTWNGCDYQACIWPHTMKLWYLSPFTAYAHCTAEPHFYIQHNSQSEQMKNRLKVGKIKFSLTIEVQRIESLYWSETVDCDSNDSNNVSVWHLMGAWYSSITF